MHRRSFLAALAGLPFAAQAARLAPAPPVPAETLAVAPASTEAVLAGTHWETNTVTVLGEEFYGIAVHDPRKFVAWLPVTDQVWRDATG